MLFFADGYLKLVHHREHVFPDLALPFSDLAVVFPNLVSALKIAISGNNGQRSAGPLLRLLAYGPKMSLKAALFFCFFPFANRKQ